MRASQTVLPFKLTASDESLTAQAGLVLFDEYLGAMGVAGLINHELPGAGSAAGYDPSAHVSPLVLMLAGGGRTLEDLRVLRRDDGLRCVVGLDEMPSSDASGDWMRRMGANESGGLAGLQRVNRCVFRRLLRADDRTDFTLDIDATQIVAEKREARYTYKGEKGYMPMVGHIAENSLVIDHEFREGNAAPAARNLEFVQACERKMPKGKRIKAVRADSAAYQADVFNYCEETHKVFAIGGGSGRGGQSRDCGHSGRRLEDVSRRRNRRDGPLHEQDRQGVPIDRHATSSGPGFVRGQVALPLSRHRQQSPERRRGYHAGMVFATRRREREPHQGFESRLRHGIHALRFVPGQRGLLRHRGADLQSVSRLSLPCPWKRMGAFASADRALAVVSDRGQDRAPRPTDFLADRRRHVGHVRRDPPALREHHAGRRCHSGDVVIPGAFARWGKWNNEPHRRSRAANIRNRQPGRQKSPSEPITGESGRGRAA